jgi:hypothetical protein
VYVILYLCNDCVDYADALQTNLDRLKLSLNMLRNVIKCTLPIELYHFDNEMQNPTVRKELEEKYDVRLRVVSLRYLHSGR